jgi:beta-D-xylosidase 4
VNPSGRLTQTFYPNEYTAQIEMADMHMRPDAVTGRPGRTYRFYTG